MQSGLEIPPPPPKVDFFIQVSGSKKIKIKPLSVAAFLNFKYFSIREWFSLPRIQILFEFIASYGNSNRGQFLNHWHQYNNGESGSCSLNYSHISSELDQQAPEQGILTCPQLFLMGKRNSRLFPRQTITTTLRNKQGNHRPKKPSNADKINSTKDPTQNKRMSSEAWDNAASLNNKCQIRESRSMANQGVLQIKRGHLEISKCKIRKSRKCTILESVNVKHKDPPQS